MKILWYYERFAYRNADYLWFKTSEDKHYATLYYKVKEENCFVIPYGVNMLSLPTNDELLFCKKELQRKYSITENETILLFNGTLSYRPNFEALQHILDNINPLLRQTSLQYKILVCGKGLPIEFNELKNYRESNIIYCGFVDDIDLYFKGCDIFLNPLQDGGGIKTKLVEALGFGKKCVSSVNGAIGVSEESTSKRLMIVADKDWDAYLHAILALHETDISNDNMKFYETYSWKSIAEKAVSSLS